MQTKLWATALLGVSLGVAATARSDELATARGIINEAIRAIGGDATLTKFQAATWKSKGVFKLGDTAAEFTSDWGIQATDQYRKAKSYSDGKTTVLVMNKDQAWFATKQGVATFRGRHFEGVRAEHYTHWLSLRLDIKSDARLSLLEETQVDGRPAAGVKVQAKDAPDVDLYFDKATGLLVRSDTYITSTFFETRLFRNYKETDGIKYASVVHWTGKNGEEVAAQEEVRSDFAVHERLDEALFAKPALAN